MSLYISSESVAAAFIPVGVSKASGGVAKNNPKVLMPLGHKKSGSKIQAMLMMCLVLLAHLAIIYFFLWQNNTESIKLEPVKPMLVSLIAPPAPEPEMVPIIEPPKPVIKPKPKVKKVVKKVIKKIAPIETPAELLIEAIPEPIEEEVVEPEVSVPVLAEKVSTENKAPKPVVEEKIEPPRFGVAYLNNPAPRYPKLSRRKGEEGRVLLRVLVSEAGDAVEVNLEKTSGSHRLDRAAILAVKKWRFIPARKNNQALSAYVLVPIKFSLEG